MEYWLFPTAINFVTKLHIVPIVLTIQNRFNNNINARECTTYST